jgi:hypothetical protein
LIQLKMSIRVYRPLSVEAGRPPYRPLLFEVGVEYYHAESVVRDNNLEFWANPSDLTYVGTFVEEAMSSIDENAPNGAIFVLNNSEHFIEYDVSGNTCFTRGPRRLQHGAMM